MSAFSLLPSAYSPRRPDMRASFKILPLLALMALLAGCRSDAAWSPDGRQIALDVKGLLFTFDLESRKFQQQTRGPQVALNPAWAPNGRQMAYYRATRKAEEISALEL